MAQTWLMTWKDLIDHLVDWSGAQPGAEVKRDARKASLEAVRDLASRGEWSYYVARGRVQLRAPYQEGTAAYTHTGGSYERVLTLTGGAWPSWAMQGTALLGAVPYEVASRKSDTELVLSVNSNPGQDVASAAYLLYQDTYPLPQDFGAAGEVILLQQNVRLRFEHPSTWLERQRVHRGPGCPRSYTVRGSPDWVNTLAVSFYPPPDQAYDCDFVYRRLPRGLRLDEFKAGTLTTAEGEAAVAGSATAWPPRLAGSILRVSGSRAEEPTAAWGSNPALYERVIVSVDSATALTLDGTIPETLAGVKYVISDPVDVETGSMMTALLRGCQHFFAQARHMADRAQAQQEYRQALIEAHEADARSFQRQEAGGPGGWPRRLRDHPSGPDL